MWVDGVTAEASMESPKKHDICVLCCREVKIHAVGSCDHPICHECSTRLRCLCKQTECPICRRELPKVFFSTSELSYQDVLSWKRTPFNHRYKICFENEQVQMEFSILLDHPCRECPSKCSFRSFTHLKDHMRKVHEKYFCDLCVDHLHVFTYERKTYTRKELAKHRRVGDTDDTSHKGHPLCEFCDSRFMDNDELYKHLRRDHFFCHFCDNDGGNQYYGDYNLLREHFRGSHFLCEEDNCREEKFTSVFRTDIDYKAHKSQCHTKSMSKAQAKQARTLEIEFAIAPRPPPSKGPPRTADHGGPPQAREPYLRGSSNLPSNISTVSAPIHEDAPVLEVDQSGPNMDCQEEFPTLVKSSIPTETNSRNTNSRAMSNPFRNVKGYVNDSDYPSLTSTSKATQSVPSYGRSKANNDSMSKRLTMGFNSKEDFPALSKSGPVDRNHSSPSMNSTPHASIQLSRKGTVPIAPQNNPYDRKPKQVSSHSSFVLQNPQISNQDFPALTSSKPSVATVVASSHPTQDEGLSFTSKKSKTKKKGKKKEDGHCAEDDSNKRKKKVNTEPGDKTPANDNSGRRNDIENIEPCATKLSDDSSSQNGSPAEDFPPLLSKNAPPGFNTTVSQKVTPAPPGFRTAAPPGFSNTIKDVPSVTFTSSNGKEYNVSASQSSYSQPANFGERNQRLIQTIRTVLNGDNDKFSDFKCISGEFRRDNISANEYYTKCLDVFGHKNFKKIFPELLVLLPEINKQQDLFQVHNNLQKSEMKSKGAKPKSNSQASEFLVCAACQQVLCSKDFQNHMSNHNMENNFPMLPNAGSDVGNRTTRITWTRKS